MKIRNGFVSNSSSSSFVVVFPEKVESPEQVKRLLFDPDRTEYCAAWHDGSFSTEQVAETVYNDALRGGPMKGKRLAEALEGIGWHDLGNVFGIELGDSPDKPRWEAPNEEWDEYDKQMNEYLSSLAKQIQKKFPGQYLYAFSYGDEDGEYFSSLEHGDVFEKLPHVRISHH